MKTLIYLSLSLLLLPGCLAKSKKTPPNVIEIPGREYEEPDREPPPLGPQRPNFVGRDAFEDRLVIDSGSLDGAQQVDTFYANGCDRYNNGEEVIGVKKALDFALNMLSTDSRKAKTTTTGNADCIFRIDQSDFNLSDEKLAMVIRRSLFRVESRTTRGDIIKFNILQERQPIEITNEYGQRQIIPNPVKELGITWLFVDDFIITAMESDILTNWDGDTYRTLVEQPLYDVDFWAQELGGEQLQDLFDRQEALAGCTVTDKIAYGKGRCFAHVEGVNGLINVARDSSNNNPVSVQQTPFLIEVALASSDGGFQRQPATNNVYNDAASETFYALPNGCPGLRLSANGIGVGFAPLDIVHHPDLRNIDNQIYFGLCTNCHDGSKGYEEAGYGIVFAPASPFNEIEKNLAAVFYKDTAIRQHLREYNEEFRECTAYFDIGVGEPDPLSVRGILPLKDGQTVGELAGKFMEPPEQYTGCLAATQQSAGDLGGHLRGSNLSLATVAQREDPVNRTGPNAYDNAIRECNYWQNREI